MSLGGLIGSAVLVAITLGVLLQPFLRKRRHVERMVLSNKQQTQDELVTTYERVLSMIRDLDEDYNTGKLHPDNYQEDRDHWAEQGVKLLQQIEVKEDVVLHVDDEIEIESDEADDVLDNAIEKAISEYRKAQT